MAGRLEHPSWNALLATIDDLYTVFAHYTLRDEITGCDHCVDPSYNDVLHAKPLRELTCDDLSLLVGNLSTWGEVEDFKHFLPRLLDLVAHRIVGETCIFDGDDLLSHARHTGYLDKLTHNERAALNAFLSAWWQARLDAEPSTLHYSEADGVLTAIAQVVDDLTPYLRVWRETRSLAGLCHLAIFIYVNFMRPSSARSSSGRYLPSSGLGALPAQRAQMLTWVHDPSTGRYAHEVLERVQIEHGHKHPSLAGDLGRIIDYALVWLDVEAASKP